MLHLNISNMCKCPKCNLMKNFAHSCTLKLNNVTFDWVIFICSLASCFISVFLWMWNHLNFLSRGFLHSHLSQERWNWSFYFRWNAQYLTLHSCSNAFAQTCTQWIFEKAAVWHVAFIFTATCLFPRDPGLDKLLHFPAALAWTAGLTRRSHSWCWVGTDGQTDTWWPLNTTASCTALAATTVAKHWSPSWR